MRSNLHIRIFIIAVAMCCYISELKSQIYYPDPSDLMRVGIQFPQSILTAPVPGDPNNIMDFYFGDGRVKLGADNGFTYTYTTEGTYTIKAELYSRKWRWQYSSGIFVNNPTKDRLLATYNLSFTAHKPWHNQTLPGDADGNGVVDTNDLNGVVSQLLLYCNNQNNNNITLVAKPVGVPQADVDNDGFITVSDLMSEISYLQPRSALIINPGNAPRVDADRKIWVEMHLDGRNNSTKLASFGNFLEFYFDNNTSKAPSLDGSCTELLAPGTHSYRIILNLGSCGSVLIESGTFIVPDITVATSLNTIQSTPTFQNIGFFQLEVSGTTWVYEPFSSSPSPYPITTVYQWKIDGMDYATQTYTSVWPTYQTTSTLYYVYLLPGTHTVTVKATSTCLGLSSVSYTSTQVICYQDMSGTSGTSGSTGSMGESGSTGTSGDYGYSGYDGMSGYTGSDGSSGYSGSSGDYGYSGSDGMSGYTGSDGSSGYSGTSGDYGYSGYDGMSGYTGSDGSSGYSGASGDYGYSGSSGDYGYSGYSGSDGSSGYYGYSGSDGSSGDYGYSSSDGYSGSSGSNGSSGDYSYSGYYRGRVDNNLSNNELKIDIQILSNTILNITCSEPPHSHLSIQMFDLTGKMVENRQIDMDYDRIYKQNLNKNGLKPGLYLVNVKIVNVNITKKIIL